MTKSTNKHKKIADEKDSTSTSCYTIFYDMYSGGSGKESFDKLAVRLPKEKAVDWFKSKYRDPYNITCECCGQDYEVNVSETPMDADVIIENPFE